jgi:hypothetical protein
MIRTRRSVLACSIAAMALVFTVGVARPASAGLLGGLLGTVGGVLGGVVGGVVGVLAPPVQGSGPFVLRFEATPNVYKTPHGSEPVARPSNASATMTMSVVNGETDVEFSVRNVRPNTIYTIWTVFYPLQWPIYIAPGSYRPITDPDFPNGPTGFYVDGSPVAPAASLSAQFTNGMGLDPGITFVTDRYGNASMRLRLDYNLLGNTYEDGPPVGNKAMVTQCVVDAPGPQRGPCPSGGTQRVTTTWLRKYIAQVPAENRAAECANYDPSNPEIFWQCIDPATVDPDTGNGLPRVWRFPFDHFRLAAHPDGLTHGFIGGNESEHVIDMVGRRCKLTGTCPQ